MAVFMATLAVAGCQGSGGSNAPAAQSSQEVRATVITAPADLQLICASRAVEQFSASADQVLPTSSQQTSPGTYQVVLSVPAGSANCVIDDNATISTLELVS